MKYEYLCPYCLGKLKVNNQIIFSARTPMGDRGIIILSPELGDYNIVKHEQFTFKDGEHLEFLCPLCHANLSCLHPRNLAEVLMVDENGKEYEIFFSEIAGEKCTYKKSEEKLEKFGDDADHYMNYFGESPKY